MKKIKCLYPFYLLVLSLITSCNSNTSNSLSKEVIAVKEIKQYKFLLEPINSKKLFEINYKGKNIPAEQENEVIKEYDDFCCFRFEIQVNGFNKEITEYYDKYDEKVDYEELLDYYLFNMQQDLKLFMLDGQEIPCNIYLFERNFELTKSNRFMVGFKKPKEFQTITFSYNNRYLNIGKVNFQITKNDFKG